MHARARGIALAVRELVGRLRDILGAAGLEHPEQIGPEHILRRISPTQVSSLEALYRFLQPGELLDRVPEHAVFRMFWSVSTATSFHLPQRTPASVATGVR